MQQPSFDPVGIVGAGVMGHGIAETCAMAGLTVYLQDVDTVILDKAMLRIKESLALLARKRRVHADKIGDIMDKIHPCTRLDEFAEKTRFCIESVPEIMGLKQQVLRALDEALPAGGTIATNTSTMSITELAKVTDRPENVGRRTGRPPSPRLLGQNK